MGHRVLPAADAVWRAQTQRGVMNPDRAKQLAAEEPRARLCARRAGQAPTGPRHAGQVELYVLLEGTGRVRVDGELYTLEPLSALVVEPRTFRHLSTNT